MKSKNYREIKSWTCPHCEEKQYKIWEWQSCSVLTEYDNKNKTKEVVDIVYGEFEGFECPNCGNSIPNNSPLFKRLYKEITS